MAKAMDELTMRISGTTPEEVANRREKWAAQETSVVIEGTMESAMERELSCWMQ